MAYEAKTTLKSLKIPKPLLKVIEKKAKINKVTVHGYLIKLITEAHQLNS